jgi:hypothetical protein
MTTRKFPALKYSPEVVHRITTAIFLGATRTLAAAYGGVTDDTILLWEKKYPEFLTAMRAARARRAMKLLGSLERHVDAGDKQAILWELEHVFPEDFGRTVSEQRHSGPDGKEPVKFTIVIDRNPHDAEMEGG